MTTLTGPNSESLAAVTRCCHDHGVLTLSAGTFGNFVRLLLQPTIAHLRKEQP